VSFKSTGLEFISIQHKAAMTPHLKRLHFLYQGPNLALALCSLLLTFVVFHVASWIACLATVPNYLQQDVWSIQWNTMKRESSRPCLS